MSFIYPQFLFALFAVAIPIIIHLFNFRRFKKVYFSDIRFLKEVKLQTQNRNRIKHLLILLSRILAITFLVLAFAQPFIPNQNKNVTAGIQALSIYIDNSFSMENVSKNGMLLDESKKIAREIALAHAETDQLQLLTNDFEGRHQRLLSREEFLNLLDEVKISPAVKTISEVTTRQNDLLAKAETRNRKSFLISDFQRSVADLEKVRQDSSIRTILLPVAANQENNLYIDSCWFDAPVHQLNEPEKLNIRIKNISENNLENIPAKIFLNNQQRSPASFSIQAGESKDIQMTFVIKEPGIQYGRIEITDYPVTYDDKFYFSFSVAKNIPVTCIAPSKIPLEQEADPKRSIESLYGKDSLFVFTSAIENKLDYSALASQQVILLAGIKNISSGLSQELNRFVQNGGSLVVFPAGDADTASYKAFLSGMQANYFLKRDTVNTKTDWVNFESDIFSDVFDQASVAKQENLDLPMVHEHFNMSRSNRTNEEILLKLKNGESLVSKYGFKKGKLYLSSVPLDPEWSNLAKHAIFVPLMYKIAMNSQRAEELFYTVGRSTSIKSPARLSGESIFRIKGENTAEGFDIIPESRVVDLEHTIFIYDQIRNAGNYGLYASYDLISGLAFNYDRKESDLKRYTNDEMVAAFEKNSLSNFSLIDAEKGEISKILADISQGKKLWKWCILATLLFLGVEIALLKLLKN